MGFALNYAHKFWNGQLTAIRKKGVLDADEQVEDMVGFYKRSQLVMLAGLFARFLQKQYLLIVTDRRVLLVHIPSFLVHGSGYYQHVSVNRPCRIVLSDKPKAEHHVGCKVLLPEPFAEFVGRPHGYVVFGLEAQRVFDLASQPGSGAESVSSDSVKEPSQVPVTQTSADEFVRFQCPKCGKALKAKRELRGKRIRCTRTECGEVLQVPSA